MAEETIVIEGELDGGIKFVLTPPWLDIWMEDEKQTIMEKVNE